MILHLSASSWKWQKNWKQFLSNAAFFWFRLQGWEDARKHEAGGRNLYGFCNNNNGISNDRKSKFLVNSFLSGATTKSTNLVTTAFCITQCVKVFVFQRHKLKFLLVLNRFDIFLFLAEAISRWYYSHFYVNIGRLGKLADSTFSILLSRFRSPFYF